MSKVKDAMNEWGRNYLREQGFEISDDADVSYEEETVYDGYCNTCYSSWEVVDVIADGYAARYSGSMYELLEEMNKEVDND